MSDKKDSLFRSVAEYYYSSIEMDIKNKKNEIRFSAYNRVRLRQKQGDVLWTDMTIISVGENKYYEDIYFDLEEADAFLKRLGDEIIKYLLDQVPSNYVCTNSTYDIEQDELRCSTKVGGFHEYYIYGKYVVINFCIRRKGLIPKLCSLLRPSPERLYHKKQVRQFRKYEKRHRKIDFHF